MLDICNRVTSAQTEKLANQEDQHSTLLSKHTITHSPLLIND